MLYATLKTLEKTYPWFNSFFHKADSLLSLLEAFQVQAIPDRTIQRACLIRGKRPLLLYNPYLHPDDLVITLGHELGHILLGHYQYYDVLFSERAYFSKSGIEKDAGIVGFLLWVPTQRLRQLEAQNRLSSEELAWELHTCDTEWLLLYRLCEARIRIYKALRRIECVGWF